MAILKLFISHSSKNEVNIQLLHDVCNGLDRKNLIDSSTKINLIYDLNGTIVASDDWYSKIDRWMLEANAAVILFSKKALFDSDWVKKETSILTWRNNLDPDFLVIPVLLDGLEPKEFEKGLYGVLKISSRQCIQSTGNADQICHETIKALSAKQPVLNTGTCTFSGCSHEPLEGVLAEIITSHPSHAALHSAVDQLNLDLPDWPPEEYKRNALAAARFLLEVPENSMRNLIDLLDSFNPRLPQESADSLINYVKGIWVDRSAASGILLAWKDQYFVGLNGNKVRNYSAKRYCERAWPMSSKWKLIRVNTTSTTLEEIKSDIDLELDPSASKTPDQQRIQNRIKKSPHIFIILLSAQTLSASHSNDITSELRERYRGAIFLVDMGSGQFEWLSISTLQLLSPPLDTDLEQNQFDDYQDAQDILTQLYGTS